MGAVAGSVAMDVDGMYDGSIGAGGLYIFMPILSQRLVGFALVVGFGECLSSIRGVTDSGGNCSQPGYGS